MQFAKLISMLYKKSKDIPLINNIVKYYFY